MRLLILTQVVDTEDPVLGFFHGWVAALAPRFDSIQVVCLREGSHRLPENVEVHSLGKERGVSRATYIVRFFAYAWRLRREYDAVFVHMNPEYVVLGGVLWRLLGKRVYLWRNHGSGGLLTDIAVLLSHKAFCTSRISYITKYRKNVLMPVGVDTSVFHPTSSPVPRSILSLGRIAPNKRIEVILGALKVLKDRGVAYTADIYGDALPKDESYLREQKQFVETHGLTDRVAFRPGIPNAQTPGIYASHEIFVNASESGMFDKTIFEALACGSAAIASSPDYADFAGRDYTFPPGSAEGLAARIEARLGGGVPKDMQTRLEDAHSLRALTDRLVVEMSV